MDYNFTERARKAKELAAAQARWLRKKAIGAENLLYGLLQSGPNLATAVINKTGLGDKLKEELEQHEEQPERPAEATDEKPEWDSVCAKIVERAAAEAKELGQKFIGTEHLFLGLISEQVGKAGGLLREAGIEYPKVRKELLEFLGLKEEESKKAEPGAEGVVEVGIRQRESCKDLPLPRYMSESASGMDLYAAVDGEVVLEAGKIMLVPTGISVALPAGYEAQVRPRSGLALKHGITIVNSPGTIDSDYRGEVGVIVGNMGDKPFVISRGMRIAQMVIQPVVKAKLIALDKLDDTTRGAGGFGSSGV